MDGKHAAAKPWLRSRATRAPRRQQPARDAGAGRAERRAGERAAAACAPLSGLRQQFEADRLAA
ncbi:hypothetical protein, partial [Xanthomonas graminis]|uniref:hypothetical protein n=1 Tax=Xanthomonas graminis TaxID=3390026 RepID=UPI001BAEC428